jgi:dihydroorotase
LTSKQVTYQDAAFGISVLETALGSLLQLVHTNKLSMGAMVDRLTNGPARVLGESYSHLASLQPGTTADLVLFDPEQEWTVDTSEFESKGRNTPLEGTTLKGRVVATFASGRMIYQAPGLKIEEFRGKD